MFKPNFQTTLADRVEIEGHGVHSGTSAHLIIHPADVDSGIVFLRTGLENDGERLIEAKWSNITHTSLCTVLGDDAGASVGTVEHLLAALAALRVDNATIEIDGPEIPIMDGSSACFIEAIDAVGLISQSRRRRYIKIAKNIQVDHGRSRAELRPAPRGFHIDVEIDFESVVIGQQRRAYMLDPRVFRREIGRARTFGFMTDVKKLWQAGYALGSSLENSIAIDGDVIMNTEGLRYRDEFVRHKTLDVIGDLSLAGAPLIGSYRGYRPGHALNAQILSELFSDDRNYEIIEDSTRRIHAIGELSILSPEM